MSDKFSKEIGVANNLRKYLAETDFDVLQLTLPGGQCRLSLTYSRLDGGKKTIFPDLILFSCLRNMIVIGELKPRFSVQDRDKLKDLRDSANGLVCVRSMIGRLVKRDLANASIDFVLVHSQEETVRDIDIEQWVVLEDKVICIKPER